MPNLDEILTPEALGLQPSVVQDIFWYEFVDSIGDPALRITVVISSSAFEQFLKQHDSQKIDEAIANKLRQVGISIFPYIRYVTADEYAEEKAA